MTDLVFIEPNKMDSTPFTTSKVISEMTGVGHRHIKKNLDTYKNQFLSFGLLVLYATESTGGRPQEIYKLNEQQATFMMTLLKNTEVVVNFKSELVRQFYIMRAELMKRQMMRIQLKPIRRELTDVIKENPDKGKWSYKLYTDLAYKSVLGMNASQIRKERGATKTDVAVDYMTADEIRQITKVQGQISVLHEMGMGYEQIKAILFEKKFIGKIA